MQYFKSFSSFLERYEEANSKDTIKCDSYKNMKLIDNQAKTGLKQSLEKMIDERSNPYKQLRNWIKGEILSLEAIVETIETTDKILESRKKA